MAKIKSEKFEIDGQEFVFNYNCSSKGIFSVTIPYAIREKLGIPSDKTSGATLDELTSTVNKAYGNYIKSKTTRKLTIGVNFGACGEYIKDENDEFIREFLGHGNPNAISSSGFDFRSMIAFDYRVIMEEDKNGHTSRYTTKPYDPNDEHDRVFEWTRIVGNYRDESQIHSWKKSEKIIEFSETALVNLESIKNQLKKASAFIMKLTASEEFEALITSPNMKLLN